MKRAFEARAPGPLNSVGLQADVRRAADVKNWQ